MHRRRFLKSAALAALAPALLRAAPARAAGGDEKVIVLDSAGASITLIDQATRRVSGRVPVGKEPHHLMLLPDGQQLIVADAVGGELNFVDPVSGAYEGRLPGIEDPYQIGFSPDRKWFVANCLRLNRVDIYRYHGGHAFELARRVPLARTPSHMAFTADSRTVFISVQDSDAVAALDLASQTVRWQMLIGRATAGVWMTPGDAYLLVALTGEDAVVAVDWRRRRIVKRIVTGLAAHNFRSLADHRHVIVSNRMSNTLSIVDMQALRKVGDIRGLRPGPDDCELSTDGRWLWVTFRFAREVGVIDMRTHQLVDVIGVGRSPHGIYFHDRAPFYDNLPYADQQPIAVRSAKA